MPEDLPSAPRLDPATAMGPVSITVRDLEAQRAWYQRVLGLAVLAEAANRVALGAADGRPLVTLVGDPQAVPAARRAPGLYHVALLMPERADLGRFLRHVAAIGVRLQGAADHLVSEATYLSDPEGNGIEVYRDRPRGEWPIRDGRIHMDNAPFDLAGVAAAGDAVGRPYAGAPEGTTVGHVHLKVADVAEARAFYVDGLGFDTTEEGYPAALFVAAGGYHHHVGLNAWESAGGRRAPGTTGLRSAAVTLPAAARAALSARLDAAGLAAPAQTGTAAAVDPSGNRLVFTDAALDGTAALALA